MAALLASRFPENAPELFAYQASIVRAERNFDSRRWVAYDRCYRREVVALKNLDWSVANARLYNEAFTGHARAIPRCSFCLQENHASQACPRNPNRPWFGWLPDPTLATQTPQQGPLAPARHSQQSVVVGTMTGSASSLHTPVAIRIAALTVEAHTPAYPAYTAPMGATMETLPDQGPPSASPAPWTTPRSPLSWDNTTDVHGPPPSVADKFPSSLAAANSPYPAIYCD